MRVAKRRVEPQQCHAVVDDFDKLLLHDPRKRPTKIFAKKICPRIAKEVIGHLCLCKHHARMARSGLVDRQGVVAPHEQRRTFGRYPDRNPNGYFDWAQNLTYLV